MLVQLDIAVLTTLRELRAQWQKNLQGDDISDPVTRGKIEKTIDRITDFIADIEGDNHGI